MSINPTVPIKTPLYRSDNPQPALPMDKAWHGFLEACGKGLPRLDEHDELLSVLLLGRKARSLTITRDTHAHRVAQTPRQDFDLFFETDRNVFYMAQGGVWVYWWGVMSDTFTNLPNDLGGNDDGFQFYSTDFLHFYYWHNSLFRFSSGETSGNVVIGASGPPNGGLWHLCDGSSVSIAKAAGAFGSMTQVVTLPDLTGNVFVLGGSLARSGASAYLSQALSINYQTGTTVFSATVPQVLAPDETNGGMPLRIGVSFYVRQ